MPNNIAVSITADVADLQVKRAILSAELRQATKDLNDFAKQAKSSATTDELRTAMLGAGDAVARLKSQVANTDQQIRSLTRAEIEETVAVEANTTAHVSGRAAREALVLVHEALSGNYHRMTGSLMIEAQAMAGAERTTKVFNAAMDGARTAASAVGLSLGTAAVATVGVAVAAVAATKAVADYHAEERKAEITAQGMGAAARLTAEQLREAGADAARYSGQSVSASTDAAEAFAAAGVRSKAVITELAGDVKGYAVLTGQDAADAQKKLAEASKDPVQMAQLLNSQLGILDGTMIEHIRKLVEAGDKTGALAIAAHELTTRENEAKDAGVEFNTELEKTSSLLSDLWHGFGNVISRMIEYNALRGGESGAEFDEWGKIRNREKEGSGVNVAKAQWNQDTAAALPFLQATPEGRDALQKSKLEGAREQVKTGLAADIHLYGEHSDAVKRDREAIAEYTRALDTFIPSAEKAHRIAQLDAQISEARKKHDSASVAKLTGQRATLATAGEVMSSAEAAQRADDAADKGGASTHAAKGHKPSVVAEWTEQLHAQEIASGEFFKDETSKELAFWQSKVGLTRQGSKEWIEVQGRIYEAQKTLAHQEYDDHLAELDRRISADRDNWSKEKGDWDEKLAFVASKYGVESKQYKDAAREMENAERQHQQVLSQIAREGEQTALTELKSNLDAKRAVRQQDAQEQEAELRDRANGSPAGSIKAELAIANLHRQLAAQEIADNQAVYNKEDELRVQAIARERQANGVESKQYAEAVAAKEKADVDFYNKQRVLQNQSINRQLQDLRSLQQKWHSYVDPMISTTGAQIKGLINQTESWGQAIANIGSAAIDMVIQEIERMAAAWIVNMVTQKAAQKATTATTATSYVGMAGAAGVASMAAAPFPINLSAPAFGAKMAAAAGIFAGAAQFAKGTNELPTDMMAMIHAGERIVPAADNAKLMKAVDRGTGLDQSSFDLAAMRQASGSSSMLKEIGRMIAGIKGGDSITIHATDARSFQQLLQQNASAVGDAVRTHVRNGGRLTR